MIHEIFLKDAPRMLKAASRWHCHWNFLILIRMFWSNHSCVLRQFLGKLTLADIQSTRVYECPAKVFSESKIIQCHAVFITSIVSVVIELNHTIQICCFNDLCLQKFFQKWFWTDFYHAKILPKLDWLAPYLMAPQVEKQLEKHSALLTFMIWPGDVYVVNFTAALVGWKRQH